MKKRILVLLPTLCLSAMIAFGGTNLASTGKLTMKKKLPQSKDINTTGVALPHVRLTATNTGGPVIKPATGLIVYNTTVAGSFPTNVTPGAYYNAGTPDSVNWVPVSNKQSMGIMIEPKPIVLVSNNTSYGGTVQDAGTGNNTGGLFWPGNNLTAFGVGCMTNHVSGNDNVGFGVNVLGSLRGQSYNTAIGDGTLNKDTAGSNTAVGYNALGSNTGGVANTAVGVNALLNNQTDNNLVAIGQSAMRSYTGGTYDAGNVAVGSQASLSLVDADYVTAVGESALQLNLASLNTAVGAFAMQKNQNGNFNAAVGDGALGNSTGSYNTGMGSEAGLSFQLYNNNTAIGCQAMKNNSGFGNTSVGSQALFGVTSNVSSFNTAIGDSCMFSITTGGTNTAVGYKSLNTNATGTGNVGMGYQSLYKNTGSNNNALGYQALYTNTSGTPNDAFGYQALYSNTTGTYNDAFGYQALYTNITGYDNCAFGTAALKASTGSLNSAFGFNSLNVNTADANAAFGVNALILNTSSPSNSAFGSYALANSTTNSGYNSAFGRNALYNNSTGTGNNTACGVSAGYTITTGNHNTCIGANADVGTATFSNCGAFGNGAVATNAGDMYFGNSTINGCYNHNGVFTTSDGRFKTNIQENVKGLAFITKLRPVTYQLDTKALDDFIIQNMSDTAKAIHKAPLDFTASKAKIHSGFIAQEVEQAATTVGFTSSIVSHPGNSADPYALSYQEMVVPIVKAIQELSKANDSLTSLTTRQDSINKALTKLAAKQDSISKDLQAQLDRITRTCCPASGRLKQNGNSKGSGNDSGTGIPTGAISTELSDVNAIVLNQNVPNPFAEQTSITYNIPVINSSAQISFYNTNGMMIKSVEIKTTGEGQLTVYANDLTNGIYSYTLIVDGKIIDTKKMVKQQ